MRRWVRRVLATTLTCAVAAVAVALVAGTTASTQVRRARLAGAHVTGRVISRHTPGISARLAPARSAPTPTPTPTPTAQLAPAQPSPSGAVPAPRASMEHGHNRRHLCTAGLVALTFDDGPRPGTTRRLLGELRRLQVPATFFEIGQHVAQHPELSRAVDRAGFAVENHSWSHPDLTKLSDAAVTRQIRSTARALKTAGVQPGGLMRPPYGAVNPRVARDIRAAGLTPTLWNVDSGDWRGGSTKQIAASVLAQLRPRRIRPFGNVVLQHDGVTNSPASVRAVPRIVRAARHRGYCFAPLGPNGRPVPPTPHLRVAVAGGQEAGRPVALTLRLDQPTSVATSVHLTSLDGSAVAGADYVPLDLVVRFAPGVTYAIVRVPVVDDAVAEPPEAFGVRLSDPVGLTPTTEMVTAGIGDNDPPPASTG